jgi:hypothetical protein
MSDDTTTDKKDEDARMIKEWLAKGNKVTICPPGQKSDPEKIVNKWQRKQGRPKSKK